MTKACMWGKEQLCNKQCWHSRVVHVLKNEGRVSFTPQEMN